MFDPRLQTYEETCYIIDMVLDHLELLVCKRCHREDANRKHESQPTQLFRNPHHMGKWMKLLETDNGIPIDRVKTWVDDEEHGLFHGFATLVVAACHSPHILHAGFGLEVTRQGISASEKLYTACLLHDLGRFVKTNKKHDMVLQDIFPRLPVVIFTHSDPQRDQHPLIIGDRLELRRYEDFDRWAKHDMMPETNDRLDCFYNIIRPALNDFWHGRHDTWVRFGTEKNHNEIFTCDTYPPANTWDSFKYQSGKGWPCEMGELTGHLFEHQGRPWYNMFGAIKLEELLKADAKFVGDSRDHPYCIGSTPKDKWIFGHALYNLGNPWREKVQDMIHNEMPLAPVHTTMKMIHVLGLYQSMIQGLIGKTEK
jgi:hypothetical protein